MPRRGGRPPWPSQSGRSAGSLKRASPAAPSNSAITCAASATVSASTETTSSERQAGSTPVIGTKPGVGFRPTRLLKPAGTRPEPAVSVPSANGTSPRATTEAEPELEPPLT